MSKNNDSRYVTWGGLVVMLVLWEVGTIIGDILVALWARG